MYKKIRRIWKKIFALVFFNPIIQWLLAFIIAGIIWTVYLTSKHKTINGASLQNYKNKPVVFVFFHGRMTMLSPVIKTSGVPAYCIASKHQDGRMTARLQRLFGLRAIYGSSTKGALSVLREGVRIIKDKKCSLCITVDGPSGPSMRVKDGALYFASMTGAPIVPCCFSASRGFFMNRWDRFLVPKCFGEIICEIGDPVYVKPHLSSEEFESTRSEIEQIMEKQLRDLDAKFNLFHVERDLTATEFKKQKH